MLGRSPVESNSVDVGWMCPLKRQQAGRERESELAYDSLTRSRLYWGGRKSRSWINRL